MKFVKILSIESIGIKRTYDLKVKDNHNFFLANGILSHNCATTQSYYETNPDFRDGVDEVILMKLGAEDIKSLARDYAVSSTNTNMLNSLKTGQFILFRDLREKNEEPTKYRVFYVPFAHREMGYPTFWTYWKQRYPVRMIKYKDVIKDMEKRQKLQFEQQVIRAEEFIQKIRKHKEEKALDKKEEEEEPEIIEEKTTRKNKKRKYHTEYDTTAEIIMEPKQIFDLNATTPQTEEKMDDQKGYDFVNSTPDASWEARGFTLEINHELLQRNSIKHALKIQDFNFIKKFADKNVVNKFYPEFESEIYG